MNIHIKNKSLFNRLLKSTIFSTEIGSKMYKTSDEKSDTDILHIYKTSDLELNSILNSHHQLQFKENNIDYIFSSLHSFLRNTLSGDSTINFEVINSENLINSKLNFLYENRKSFYTYKIMRSYLGFGRRDLKQINLGKGKRGKNKKLFHAYRCYKSCLDIYNGEFNSIINNPKSFEIKEKIFNNEDYKYRDFLKNSLKDEIDNLRNKINSDYNDGKLINFMKIKDLSFIDSMINSIMKDNILKKMDFNRKEINGIIY